MSLTDTTSASADIRPVGGAAGAPSLTQRARDVADIAARHAETVDRDAVFPADAVAAARRANLFGMMIPRAFGGEGASVSEAAEVCYTLGRACASTAMVVAMHQAALACIIRHHHDKPWHVALLRRIAAENLLLASSTTEGMNGGNVRSSAAPLTHSEDRIAFERAATVMSYGAEADAIVTTARRDADSVASNQALVIFLKQDCALQPTGSWQTLGMRGTCSAGFSLKAEGSAEQILPVGYEKIHPQSMVPVSHLVWSAVWTGIAAAAVSRAQSFVRTAARRAGGQMPPGAHQFTRAAAALRSLRGTLAAALAEYEAVRDDPLVLGSLEMQSALNLLKVDVSDRAVEIVTIAMRACGLAGYRNDGDFTVGRHLRDILSAPVMVHNDRILSNISAATLMSGVPEALRG